MNKAEFIRLLREDGCTYRKIGEIFGVTNTSINQNTKYRFPRPTIERKKRYIPKLPPLEIRFIKKILFSGQNDCWIWTGSKYPLGYGRLTSRQYAHRYSYQFYYGNIPADCPIIMHTCDNPSCVNPRHLIAGTMMDNMHDRDRKGRSRGFHRALSKKQVYEIRKIYKPPTTSLVYLANKYCVNAATILDAIKKDGAYKNF